MRKHSIPNFIQKTWQMLEQQSNWSIVSWNQQGTCFEVHNQSEFCSELLPHYFKHSNFASFIRQLNMYNFHKQKTVSGNIEFFHKLFRKNHRELLIGIKRKPSQAQINQAEQLIKQLAPECLEEISSESAKSPIPPEESLEPHYLPEYSMNYYPDMNQMWILTPLMVNPYQNYQWNPEKKIKTNIIIQSTGVENSENVGYQFSY